MSEELITYEVKDGVAYLGINRHQKRNALHGPLFQAIADAVLKAEDEASVGIIYGHGDQFSSGLDLAYAANEMMVGDQTRRKRRPDVSREAFDQIARGEIPWIAALHGAVVGAGFELAAAAHIRVADDSAFFALPECARGIFVGGGGSVRIQRLIGTARMTDMMLTGRVYSAAEAETFAAVQYLTPKGGALEKAAALAARIARNAPLSNFAVTSALPRIADMPADEGLFVEQLAASFIVTEDSTRRLRDFLEKRAEPLRDKAQPGAE